MDTTMMTMTTSKELGAIQDISPYAIVINENSATMAATLRTADNTATNVAETKSVQRLQGQNSYIVTSTAKKTKTQAKQITVTVLKFPSTNTGYINTDTDITATANVPTTMVMAAVEFFGAPPLNMASISLNDNANTANTDFRDENLNNDIGGILKFG